MVVLGHGFFLSDSLVISVGISAPSCGETESGQGKKSKS